LTPININYNCCAFRSGGYGLQPNSNTIIKALINSGFMIDSSVVPNLIEKSNVNEVDFSIVPKMANYYLDYDLSASKSGKGIFEIPIASYKFNLIDNFFYKIKILLTFLLYRAKNGKAKGYPIQEEENVSKYLKYYNFLKSFNDRFYYLNCSTNDAIMFQSTKKYLMQFDYTKKDVFFSFNMHPKMMTTEHFQALKNYHNKLTIYYNDNIQAISFQQAAEKLAKNIL
jgi:hypothetical protein